MGFSRTAIRFLQRYGLMAFARCRSFVLCGLISDILKFESNLAWNGKPNHFSEKQALRNLLLVIT